MGNPLQYPCLGNPMDRGDWWVRIHGAAKESDTTQQVNDNTITQLLSIRHLSVYYTTYLYAMAVYQSSIYLTIYMPSVYLLRDFV